MNKIYQLFDEQYVAALFKKRILPQYPDFTKIKKIKIRAPKKHIWEETYHVVIEYETSFITKAGKVRKLPIYCTAHSEEPRRNVYIVLKFLWDHGFAKGNLTIPHPLFYSNNFRATFYRGVKGRNLYQFIRDNNLQEIEKIIVRAAHWFAKLHGLPNGQARNFNKENSRMATVIPGVKHILNRVRRDYPSYAPVYEKVYEIMLEKEKNFLASTDKRWLIHGDAHPENIIKVSERKIAVIDFTDLCLADFARDLGAFLQQLEFMIQRKIGDKNYIALIKTKFLKNYLDFAKIEIDEPLQDRINTYYHWTALRTATFFLIKDDPEPERAHGLLVKICYDMKLDCHIKTPDKNGCKL